MATIYQVAELAGVSLATVSRVMNKNSNVSAKTRDKVQAAMDSLGYRPNSIAQSLASNRSNSVGFLVSELTGPYYGPLMSGIEARLRTAEKHVIITAGHSDEAKEKDGIEFLISRRCDALILHAEAVSDEYLIELSQGSVPIVLINRYIEAIKDRCINLNDEQGGYIAAKHMLDMGHQQLAYISGPLWKSDASDRQSGHKRAISEAGLTFNEKLVYEGDYQETGGVEGIEHLLDLGIEFTAVVCGNDEMASGAMATIRERGLNVPGDISVIGFDDTTFARYVYPKLSTIDYPVVDIGHMAACWVLKHVYKAKNLDIQNVFEPKLVSRHSVRQLP